ncbi:S26 family signal peptidase [Sphaerimonospora mesophila]|uniref:S26 family signal peptidase n=1 Tax=Sphaerimonospora mesophila TaxID=37483 RepID=UPI0006E21761
MFVILIVVGLPAAALPVAAVWLRRRYLVVTVRGESMLPTYQPGERVLVRRTSARFLHTGQVVVLNGPQQIIKRVAAAPGDPIPKETVPALSTAPGTRVPAGHLVLLGDNPTRSHDSRDSGYFTTDRLVGVVLRKMG